MYKFVLKHAKNHQKGGGFYRFIILRGSQTCEYWQYSFFWDVPNPGIVSNLMKPKSAKNPPPFLYGYKVFIAENIESDGVFNEI